MYEVSIYQVSNAKKFFDENRDALSPNKDAVAFNLNAGLAELVRGLEQDLGRLETLIHNLGSEISSLRRG